MVEVYSDFIQFQGTHGDFGYMQGELLKDSPILPNRKKLWQSLYKHQFHIDSKSYLSILNTFAPNLLAEIEGLANALEMSLDEAIREFGGFYQEYGRSGCTIVTGSDFMIRNYDNDPLSYEGRLVAFRPTSGGYATIGPSMQITGRTDGMNEKGLAIGYNFINTRQSQDGFVCNMIARIVLETCVDVKEAIELLMEIPHRHSFSYVLIDSNESVIVEASPRTVVVRKDFVCANHFDILTDENRYRVQDSLRRVRIIRERESIMNNLDQAFEMMNHKEKGIFSNNYGAWSGTIHTATYHPEKLDVGFALGGNQRPLLLNFNQDVKEKRWAIKQMKGYLDTDIPFVNMVEL